MPLAHVMRTRSLALAPRTLILLGICAGVSGCAVAGFGAGVATTQGNAEQERGAGGLFNTAPVVEAPEKSRCAVQARADFREVCERVKAKAQLYARQLATGDQVCLENGLGHPPD